MYRTGTFQIRGSESSNELFEVKQELIERLESTGVPFSKDSFRHATSVHLADLGQDVELENWPWFLA